MGKHENTLKNHQNGSQKVPWDGLGDPWRTPSERGTPSGVDFESILAPIWCPFWLPCGSDFGVIFCVFFWNALGALSGCLGWDLGAFWGTFGSIFGVFLGSPHEVKTVLPLRREHHFRRPALSRSVLFLNTVPTLVPEHSRVHLFSEILRFGLHFGVPQGLRFLSFSIPFFRAVFPFILASPWLPKKLVGGMGGVPLGRW